MTVTLYDIPNSIPNHCWSPNTLKARIALNYKGIPHKTIWVEYPDIEPTLKKIGAKPTSKELGEDGNQHDLYTLPVLHDPSTNQVISDSYEIAKYLDKTYPNLPALFPGESAAFSALFQKFFLTNVVSSLVDLLLNDVQLKLNPGSQEYFATTRLRWYGVSLPELAPPGPKREKGWKGVKDGLDLLSGFLEANGEGKQFLLGDTFSYSDVTLISFILFAKFHLEKHEWEELTTWNGGRWAKLVESTKARILNQVVRDNCGCKNVADQLVGGPPGSTGLSSFQTALT